MYFPIDILADGTCCKVPVLVTFSVTSPLIKFFTSGTSGTRNAIVKVYIWPLLGLLDLRKLQSVILIFCAIQNGFDLVHVNLHILWQNIENQYEIK